MRESGGEGEQEGLIPPPLYPLPPGEGRYYLCNANGQYRKLITKIGAWVGGILSVWA